MMDDGLLLASGASSSRGLEAATWKKGVSTQFAAKRPESGGREADHTLTAEECDDFFRNPAHRLRGRCALAHLGVSRQKRLDLVSGKRQNPAA
jgi:hypothetical protein